MHDIEQVMWSADSVVDVAKTSSGNTASSSRADEIEVQSPPEAWNQETPVVHCFCTAFRNCVTFCQLEEDVDIIRESCDERSDEIRHMAASFRTEIDEIKLSIQKLDNTHRPSCIASRSSAKLSSGDTSGESAEDADRSRQAEAKQAMNMQVAVQKCTQRLGEVELDMLHVKDDMKAQAATLDVIQQVQQTFLKLGGRHSLQKEVKLKASNHGPSDETKAVQHPIGCEYKPFQSSHRTMPQGKISLATRPNCSSFKSNFV